MALLVELIVCLLFLLLTWICLKVRKSQRYFQERNIPCVEPSFFFGSRPSGTIFFLKHVSETYDEMYRKLSPHKIGGYYELFHPFFMVCDPEYVNQVLSSSYSHFEDRGFEVNRHLNPMDRNMAFLKGDEHRYIRKKLNPIFATMNLRDMTDDMEKCARALVGHFETAMPLDQDVDIAGPISNHNVNVAATIILGHDLRTFQDSFSLELSRMLKTFLQPTLMNGLNIFLRIIWPEFLQKLKIPTTPAELNRYFVSTVKECFRRRENELCKKKKDVLQHLMELCKKEDGNKSDSKGEDSIGIGINEEVIAAQAFILSLGASVSSAATLYNFIYFISLHPEAQNKIRREIATVKEKHGGFTFQSLKELKYLSCCINETIRLAPPGPVIARICTKSFEFPNGTKINKGYRLTIPVFSILRDAKFFPEPLKFKPERFAEGCTFDKSILQLAFGGGPNMCIGKQYAELEIKIALTLLLESFGFEPSSNDVQLKDRKYVAEPKSFSPLPKDGYKVRIKKLI